MQKQRTWFTPPAVADLLGVGVTRIYGWIYSGELQAVNLGGKKRARYRISQEAVRDFLNNRVVSSCTNRQRRRSAQVSSVTEFI